MQSNSKKRKFGDISNQQQADEELLFGTGGDRERDEGDYRGGGDDEALEDDDAALLGDDDDQEGAAGSEEEADGEDLIENMEEDYQAKPELDRYESEGLDDEGNHAELNYQQRRELERQMDQEARTRQIRGRRAGAFMDDDDELNEYNEDEEIARQMRMERMRALNTDGNAAMDEDQEMNDVIDFEDVKGQVSQWVQRPEVVRWIRKTFGNFLRNFKDDFNNGVYEERIREMCSNNKQSLEITFTHLSVKYPTLAIWLAEEPSLMLPILNEICLDVTLELFPDYHLIHSVIFARIRDLPVEDQLRDLRMIHMNSLIKIRGVVTKRTGVFPEYSKIFYRCACGDLKGPVFHSNVQEGKSFLGQCVVCQSNGPFTLDEVSTVYRNYQKMTIQETPGTVPPGRVPRQKEVFVLNDMVDTARPGDEVEITGIYINRFDYFSNVKHGFPVFSTIIEANYIRRFGDEDIIELTEEDKQQIKDLSRQPNIGKKIINSIAPSIYGHHFVKKALALSMFGGEAKDINGKHRIRGDINVLLLGDPGTAKSQFLKYVEQVFHRCVYTTGKGASAVGLTAGVHKDPITREWTLEGGALVLADKGLCLIDEFDKMNDQDRTSIHEAMEQQSISISKAGIVTSLQARCAVIAAANPLKGTYNNALNFTDNVDLTEPILSRFDILSVIKDEVNEEQDDALATFVINSHMKNHPEIAKIFAPTELMGEEQKENQLKTQQWLDDNLLNDSKIKAMAESQADQISQDILRKYIIYARRYVHPRLSEIDKEKVTQFYADIRRESNVVGGISIAVRHIESVLRMAESHAKIHLRDYVRSDDIDSAIDMLLESFLQSQKVSVARQLKKKFEPYQQKRSDPNQLLLHTLMQLVKERAIYEKVLRGVEDAERVEVRIPIDQFEHESRDYGHNLSEFFKSTAFLKEFTIEGRHIKTTTKI